MKNVKKLESIMSEKFSSMSTEKLNRIRGGCMATLPTTTTTPNGSSNDGDDGIKND